MNKKGQVGAIIVLIGILLLMAITIFDFYYPREGSIFLEKVPESMAKIVTGVGKVLGPITDVMYTIVAPVGEPPNVQAIAFAIFLLLTLVGYSALSTLFPNKYLAFLVSAIVGVIAARGLTDTILKESALVASPITVVSLILAFLPIYAVTKRCDEWSLSFGAKLAIFAAAAGAYFFIFGWIFNSITLGAIYGGGILVLGLSETVLPYFTKIKEEMKWKRTGSFMAWMGATMKKAEMLEKGAHEAG